MLLQEAVLVSDITRRDTNAGLLLRGRHEKKIWPKVRHCLTRGGRGLRGTDALSDFFLKKIKNYLKCLKCSKTCNKDIKLF